MISFCPAVCTQQTYIYITVLGPLLGFFAMVLFLLRKKVLSKWRSIIFWILLVLFLLFSVQIEYIKCESGCSTEGVYFKGLQLLPKNFFPFSMEWLYFFFR